MYLKLLKKTFSVHLTILEIRKAEHEDPDYNSEPAHHINQNKDHKFVWKTMDSAPH